MIRFVAFFIEVLLLGPTLPIWSADENPKHENTAPSENAAKPPEVLLPPV